MNKSREEKQTVAQKRAKWLILKTGTVTFAERREHQGKGNITGDHRFSYYFGRY